MILLQSIICLLLTLLTAVESMPSHVIMASNVIHPGQTFRVMHQLMAPKGSAKTRLRLSITRNGEEIVFRQINVREYGRAKLMRIQIPGDLLPGNYNLVVRARGGLSFKGTQKLNLFTKTKSLFIQTDKTAYKPKDTVRFRAVSVQSDLKPYVGELNISVFDSKRNQIQNWQAPAGSHGVWSGDFQLPSSDPAFWTIKVEAGSERTFKKVRGVQMDTFHVHVMVPSFALAMEPAVHFKVKVADMDGRPLKGFINVTAKLIPLGQDENVENVDENGFFNLIDSIDGEESIQIPRPRHGPRQVSTDLTKHKLAIKVMVTEFISGDTITKYSSVPIHARQTYLMFPPRFNDAYFKPGLPYSVQLEAFQPDGRPMAIENVHVVITGTADMETMAEDNSTSRQDHKLQEMKISIPDSGYTVFNFDAPQDVSSITITASLGSYSVRQTIAKAYSPSNSFIKLYWNLNKSTRILAGDTVEFTVRSTVPISEIVYQLYSRGQLIRIGTKKGRDRNNPTFRVVTTANMGPTARCVVHIITKDGEILADSVAFNVFRAYHNQVSLGISEREARPGDEVELLVKAAPQSQAFLIAFDKCSSGNDITPIDVYSELTEYDNMQQDDYDSSCLFSSSYPISYGGGVVSKTLDSSGVVILTDATLPTHNSFEEDMKDMSGSKPGLCTGMAGRPPMENMQKMQGFSVNKPECSENWIWTETTIGDSGEATVTAKVPDEITSWVANAFAVHSEEGFGIAPTRPMLQVRKPFYITLNIPSSVIRGEQVVIEAWVHNHLDQDQNVKVTLPFSLSYYSIHVDCDGVETNRQQAEEMTILVKAGGSNVVCFPITPVVFDHINIDVTAKSDMAGDFIRRQIDVKPEGLAIELKQSVLIDLTAEQRTVTKHLAFNLSLDTIEGTGSAKITAHGVLLPPGSIPFNLLDFTSRSDGDELIVNLALDTYLTGYLEKTGQMTEDLNTELLAHLRTGVQGEIGLQLQGGSFSINGNDVATSSMWLTAFVARIFREAASKVHIDESVLRYALSWIIGLQNDDGSFPDPAPIDNQTMQGGSASGPALTATVVIALAVNKDMYKDDTTEEGRLYYRALVNAVANLENEVDNSNDSYVMGLSSYALHLAGSNKTDQVLDRLNETAITEGDTRHWHSDQGNATDMETTSYITLTLGLRGNIGSSMWSLQYLLEHSDPAASSLNVQEQLLFFQILQEFAGVLASDEVNIDAKITVDNKTFEFNLHGENAQVTQQRLTQTSPSHVTIAATGKGVAVVEISASSNVRQDLENSFNLTATVLDGTLDQYVLEVCIGLSETDAMPRALVADIGILSGFQASETQAPSVSALIRTDVEQDGNVIMILPLVTAQESCLPLRVDRHHKVAMSKPAVVRVFDPRDLSSHATAFYSYETLEMSTLSSVCPECLMC